MPRDERPKPLPPTPVLIDSRIHEIRGHRVIIDFHLAELYGVTTAALNQAVDRNLDRFPADFAFQLDPQEFAALISQSVISKTGRGGRQKLPWVFTEHGVGMVASVLRSKQAARINIEIIRAFVRLRRLLATPGELAVQLVQLAETVQVHDEKLRVITDVLRKMMEPSPPAPPSRKIGFADTDTNA